jgi:D-aspartate ligase
MILQEYISGDDTAMRVLNCVSGPDAKVRLMCLGQPLLEDCTPTLVGNYTAIIDAYDETIFADYKKFLERIGYVGFSNFDLKYDASSKTYKVFEINLRQGRSSYFVTGSGYNQAAFLVDAFIKRKMDETVYGSRSHLWLGIPKKVLITYLEEDALKEKAMMRIKNKQTSTTLYYSKDINIMRLLRVYRYYESYKAKFKMYFVKKK